MIAGRSAARAMSGWRIGRVLRVSGPSMEPAIPDGSVIWARALRRRPVRRHDVIVFAPPSGQRLDLKRVIGLPHEEVAWTHASIHINGDRLAEPYAALPPEVPGDDDVRIVRLTSVEYFLAGDNRRHSHDSRQYGPVDRGAMLGVLGCIFPLIRL